MDQSIQAVTGIEAARAPATGPFVVNLCASAAPIEIKSGSLPGLERHRLYQVRRVEDDRPRYRLRLGFFASEAAAEIALAAVREFYPAAFSVPAASDDLKHAPGFDASVLGGRQSAVDPGNTAATGSFKRLPPVTPASRPVATAAPTVARQISPNAPATQAPLRAQAPAPKPDSPSRFPPRAPQSQAIEPAATPLRPKSVGQTAQPDAKVTLTLQADAPFIASNIPGLVPPVVTGGPILIDSTQTLRMLTETELADSDAPLWFAVQLAVSEQPINLDTMPKLDIFSAFRLYSIAMNKQGKILHSLRLGFFRESVSAEAVSGYLKTFFNSPDVLRVSAAEQTRFADPPAPPVLRETAGKSAKVVTLHQNHGQSVRAAVAPVIPGDTGKSSREQVARNPAPKSPTAKPAGKATAQATPTRAAPAAAVARKPGPTVGNKPAVRKPSLNELLNEEARQVVLSESGIRRLERRSSLLSRLVGKLTR